MMDVICRRCPAWLCDHLEHVSVALKMADRGEHGMWGAARWVKEMCLDLRATHSDPASPRGPRGTLAAAHLCQCPSFHH